jgi:hypothetical protein
MIERRYPRVYDRIQLSEVQTNGFDFNQTHDYSKELFEEIVIGSAPLERIVSFKSFLNSFKFNLAKEANIESEANKNFSIIHEKGSTLSIEITLDVPAMDAHEAMVNAGKIEELQRLIMGGRWSARPGAPPFSPTTFQNVSHEAGITTPLFYVYYRNLINSGPKYLPERISDFKDLMRVGFTCYIETVSYTPSHDVGHFQKDGKLYPKALTLSLILNYEDQSLFDEFHPLKNKKAIQPLQMNGYYSTYDTSLFPFCVNTEYSHSDLKVSLNGEIEKGQEKLYNIKMNDIQSPTTDVGKRVASGIMSTYIYISTPIGTDWYFRGERVDTGDQYARVPRWVMFRPFIEDFSRKVSTKFEKTDTGNSSIFSKVAQTGATFESLEYTLKLNIPSESLIEAKKNCGKVQHLMRMFLKKYNDGTQVLSRGPLSKKMSMEDFTSKLMFYIPSMIEAPGSGEMADPNKRREMFKKSIPLFLKDLNIEIDMDAGFFVDGIRIFPKAMSITMNMIHNRNDMIRNYTFHTDYDDTIYYRMPEFQTRSIITKEEYPFFPMDKKTIKIGR